MAFAIQVDGFRKQYDGTLAANDICFDLPAGSVGALIGPNGAGKTTTIRCLSGILKPTAGTLHVAGHDVVTQPLEVKKRIAYVPDDPPLFESLTVWEHMQFVQTAYSLGNFQAEAQALLEEFKIWDKRDSLASELSRGMRQKVAIACAYLHRPDVLFFDEPLTGLDPAAIRLLKQTIVDRARAGAAVLVSSHLLALVEDICDHLVILSKGNCLFSGSKEEARHLHDGANSLEEIFFKIVDKHESSIEPA